MTTPSLLVFIAEDNQSSLAELARSVRQSTGDFLCVLSPDGCPSISDAELDALFLECRAMNADRALFLATKNERVCTIARGHGWTVLHTLKDVRATLSDHPSTAEALRVFSPVLWRENVRSTLQSVGILSLPQLRIFLLFFLSIGIFLFSIFNFLPSCTIRLSPHQEAGNFTTNVYLVSSGAVIPTSSDQVRTLPLTILTVNITKSVTFDQISKKFTGTNARMEVTVFNDSDEEFSLRSGTRLVNQAGMRFRLQDSLIIPPHTSLRSLAVADALDQYGEVLGERGNVPAQVKWDFPGLSESSRQLVYARNEKPATGGKTSFITVLSADDIDGSSEKAGAKKILEQELLLAAKQQVQEEIVAKNDGGAQYYVELKTQRGEELNRVTFSNFSLSRQFIGQQVTSIPIEGTITYSVVLYNQAALLAIMKQEILKRIPVGQVAILDSIVRDNMDVHIIPPWDDDLRWVKITADLTYNQKYILDPFTPSGATFGKLVRESVRGKSKEEAIRILKNIPEVSNVNIVLWPPWSASLPSLESAITITEDSEP